MNPGTTRAIRRGLAGLVALIVAAVAWNIRRPPLPVPTPAPVRGSTNPADSRTQDLVYRSFKGDQESFVLRAKKMVGQEQEEMRLQIVDLVFGYVADGKPAKTHVTSDQCTYTPTLQKALFQGHVHVTTDDGFELTTESLLYSGDKGIAHSEYPVQFKRAGLTGSSTGIDYHAAEGRIDLPADVVLRIESPGQEPTDVTGGRAVLLRTENAFDIEEAVDVRQGKDTLKARRVRLDFYQDERVVSRGQAWDDVQVHTEGRSVPGIAVRTASAGSRDLHCQKLDISFRRDRSMEDVAARTDAELTIHPGPRQTPEVRHLKASVLVFHFDEKGRADEAQGQKDSEFTTEPLSAKAGPPQRVTCRNFLARLDPVTGDAKSVDFNHDVVFTRLTRRTTGDKAIYDGPHSVLSMRENPHLFDDEQKSELVASVIDFQGRAGDMTARHAVRHTFKARPKGAGTTTTLLSRSGSDTVVTARTFNYDSKIKTGYYREGALLRSEQDEIRAAEMSVLELDDGSRRLTSTGSVVSIFHPKPEASGKVPEPVETRAKEMVYEEAKGVATYTGDVVNRQGDIITKSPTSVMVLTPDGSTIKFMEAGDPVEAQQGLRHASGTHATYTPEEQVVLLVGEKVVLNDPGQEVQGRSLTFHVGDDRIIVDGREEVRTQSVFHRQPPKP